MSDKIDGRRNNRPPPNVVRTGRKPKNENRAAITPRVLPTTDEDLRKLCEEKKFSLGEGIDFLMDFYKKASS